MSSGYSSDLRLDEAVVTGQVPAENIVNYGVTIGAVNSYRLNLLPPVTIYNEGLALNVNFHQANTGPSEINVDGNGFLPIKKSVDNSLEVLEGGDLAIEPIYTLIYDGNCFQVQVASQEINPATEARQGVVRYANDQEIEEGVNDQTVISPLDITRKLSEVQTSLFKDFGTYSLPASPTLDEVEIPTAFVLQGGTIQRDQGIRILFGGNFRGSLPVLPAPADRILRVYLGDQVVLNNQNSLDYEGDYAAEIVLYNVVNTLIKGWFTLKVDGQVMEVGFLQFNTEDLSQDIVIRMTVESPMAGQIQLITRFTYTVEKIF